MAGDAGCARRGLRMDVIIVGLGAMGSAAAQQLAERGCRVLGFDQFAPPHGHGSSHGLTRIFRQAYFEDARYVPLLMRSFDLWQRLERDSGQRLLHLPGALVIGSADGQMVRRSAESAQAFGLSHEIFDAAELRRRYPVFAVNSDTVALLERDAGYVRPEACIEQQLRQAAKAGAELHTNELVIDWKAGERGSGVTVRTAKATYTADHLVLTAGPWSPRILAEPGLPLRVTRQVLCWLKPKQSLDDFREGRLPVYLIEADGDRPLLYGFPLTGADTEGVKVALHGVEEVCTPSSICREIRPGDERTIRERLANTLPGLAGEFLRGETCMYTMTPDENFVLGAHPHHNSVTVAAGFSGHGFKFAPVIGEIVADTVLQSAARWDVDLFSPNRFLRGGGLGGVLSS